MKWSYRYEHHRKVRDSAAPRNAEIVAQSEVVVSILEQLKTVGLSDRTVLLIGETGIGKETYREDQESIVSRTTS